MCADLDRQAAQVGLDSGDANIGPGPESAASHDIVDASQCDLDISLVPMVKR